MKQKNFPGILALILLSGCIGSILLVSATDSMLITRIQGVIGDVLTLGGGFNPSGNAGKVDFTTDPDSAFTGVHIVGIGQESYLTGYFWIQSVGWTTFSDVGQGKVSILQPQGGTANIRDPWTLSGYAWSENAGWIRLNPDNASWPASISPGVKYLPDTRVFTGYAWSENLGWIPMGSSSVVPGLSEGFIGRVRILGNTSATNTFDVLYSVAPKIGTTTTLASVYNLVRKNLALLFRNASSFINTTLPTGIVSNPQILNKTIYYSFANLQNSNGNIVKYSYLGSSLSSQQALVIEGGDIYIDQDVLQDQGEPRILIALQNSDGYGGNIIIDPRVKHINISMIAQGSLLSGLQKSDGSIYLYNDSKDKIAAGLPVAQLSIRGSVYSYNTIGGSAKDGTQKCPYIEVNCNRDTALKYDMNYFRAYDKNPSNQAIPGYEEYSIIVEQDTRLTTRPPLVLVK